MNFKFKPGDKVINLKTNNIGIIASLEEVERKWNFSHNTWWKEPNIIWAYWKNGSIPTQYNRDFNKIIPYSKADLILFGDINNENS